MSSTLRHQIKHIARQAQRWLPWGPTGFTLITGCPRSGTSALCTWLKHQPGIAGFDESRITIAAHHVLQCVGRFKHLAENETALTESARKLVLDFYSKQRFISGKVILDKEPLEPIAFPNQEYSSYLQSMRRLFPNLKLVFIERHVENTVWSMTRRTWGESLVTPTEISLSIQEATRIWLDSHRLILEMQNQPNTLTIQYEDLVASPVDVSRKLCDFVGIRMRAPFTPLNGKTPGFSVEESRQISEIVGHPLEKTTSTHG